MIILKLFVLTFVVVQAAIARNIRGSVRYGGDQAYKSSVNHPPAPEIYEAIPVSVVYDEGSSRSDKSIKSGIQTTNNFKPEDKEPIQSEPNAKNEFNGKNTSTREPAQVTSPKVPINSEKYDKTEKSASAFSTPTSGEQQIPVAVIYELESSFTVDLPPTTSVKPNRVQARIKKVKRPPTEEETDVDRHEPRMTEPKQVKTVNKEQESVIVSEKPQKQRENQLMVKESQSIHRSENDRTQSFPKRDNSTQQHEFVPIIKSENVLFSQNGNFKYSYEGADGTKAFEHGQLKQYEDDNAGETVSGGFSYTDKDGNEFSLSYTADENGYRPVGAHLPTPPPIPPAIARALAHLATKTTPEPVTELVMGRSREYSLSGNIPRNVPGNIPAHGNIGEFRNNINNI